MKEILIGICVCIFPYLVNGQNFGIPEANGNIAQPGLSKFVGMWTGKMGMDSIVLQLNKENILLPFPENSRSDMIVRYHCLIRNNQVVETTLNYSNSVFSDKKYSFIGGFVRNGSDMILSGILKDNPKNKLGRLVITINTAEDQLQWNLTNTEGLRIGSYDWNFTLPTQAILHKVQ